MIITKRVKYFLCIFFHFLTLRLCHTPERLMEAFFLSPLCFFFYFFCNCQVCTVIVSQPHLKIALFLSYKMKKTLYE